MLTAAYHRVHDAIHLPRLDSGDFIVIPSLIYSRLGNMQGFVVRIPRTLIGEITMEDMNRRSAMALGLTVVATTPLFSMAASAAAPTYGPDEGKELAPGVRVIEVGTRESVIPAYKNIQILDLVFQPGAALAESAMSDDMVCHITAGEFTITKGEGEKFTVKEGDMYTCAKGKPDGATNTSGVVGVHRIAVLKAA